jgi:hypothetical protein
MRPIDQDALNGFDKRRPAQGVKMFPVALIFGNLFSKFPSATPILCARVHLYKVG